MKAISILIPYKVYGPEIKIWGQPRLTNDDLNGLWEFPGGKVEPKESPRDAILREVNEETGVDLLASDISLALILENFKHNEKKLVFYIFVTNCIDKFNAKGVKIFSSLKDIHLIKNEIPPNNLVILEDFWHKVLLKK